MATLYLLGIGGLFEPYYWLFILLTSIPFLLFSFLLVRLVAPLSFKDVLHLSFYPIGAGVFTGAAFALVASGVVALLVAVGYLPEIKYDFTQWGQTEEQGIAVLKRAMYDCYKQESVTFRIVAAGLQEAYVDLRPPIDALSYLRPVITILYLVIAACVFMAAVDRRKSAVLATVLLAALIATGVNIAALKAYREWNSHNSACAEKFEELAADRTAESQLKQMALELNERKKEHADWDVSHRAEGRVFYFILRSKIPIVDLDAFHRGVAQWQKDALQQYCLSEGATFFREMAKATQITTFYNSDGQRLTSFSIGPADCPQW